ncbi:flagellar motor protein [Bacillus sp. DX1.1]|nr:MULTISPECIES: flagellar motor protein [unclassified Bacillus (in: firmicutes)]MDM5156210.1 flagellar motor protein [Bacillus sp. DX1.1]WJE80489.1 flagellar motor protein [Bacillus sp. DX3.1]
MAGGSLIFLGILIFIGLVFDQYNSKKKRKPVNK